MLNRDTANIPVTIEVKKGVLVQILVSLTSTALNSISSVSVSWK
jgi:hypothetical protein